MDQNYAVTKNVSDKRMSSEHQGPVVQSIVSLSRSLVEDLLSLTVLTKSTAAIVLSKKSLAYLDKKGTVEFLHIIRLKF